MLHQIDPVFKQCAIECSMISISSSVTGHYDKIEASKFRLAYPETFANESFDSISIASLANIFLGYRKTQPCLRFSIRSSKDGKMGIRRTNRKVKNLTKLRRIKKPSGFWETEKRFSKRHTVSRLRPFARRALITLRPPTLFMRARKPCVRTLLILLG